MYRKTLSFIVFISFVIISCMSCTSGKSVSRFSESKFSSLNRVIRDLSLFPINRNRFRLSEMKDKKAIVIFMRERDCPISEKYGPRIVRLEEEYSQRGIQFLYNYVGQWKTQESAKKDLAKFGFKGPYMIDSKQTLINELSAKTTGDVFILTPERRIIYRGPLDDQYFLLKSAIRPRNKYVKNILDHIVSGQNVDPKELSAPGCIINRPISKKKFLGTK